VVARLGVGPPPFEVLTGGGPGDEPVLGGVQGGDELPPVVGDLRFGQGQLGAELVGVLRVAVGVPGRRLQVLLRLVGEPVVDPGALELLVRGVDLGDRSSFLFAASILAIASTRRAEGMS